MSDYGSTPPPPPEPERQPQAYPGAPQPAPGYDGGSYGAPAPAPGYQNLPAGTPVAQPASIAMAVKLMYVGAALGILGVLISLFQRDAIRDAVVSANEDAGTSMTESEIDTAVTIGIGFAIFSAVLGALLWVFMAYMNGKGKKWARIVATVFFGLSVVSFLVSFAQPAAALSRILSVISILLGAYIIFLLYRPESTQFYEAQSAPRV